MRFRYDGATRFYKGNTHLHTTGSDGLWSVDETIERYQAAGYDFLCPTDHNVVTRLAGRSTDSFCLIDSTEINDEAADYRTRHVVCLGVGDDFPERNEFDTMLEAARACGAITYLAHPHWSSNTLEQWRATGLDGVEIFNGVTFYHNHKDVGLYFWDELLRDRIDVLGFAADDNHGRPADLPTHDLGWIMVAADRLERESILSAIRGGRFYSTTGPQFRSLTVDGDRLIVECTPAQHIWLLGPGWFNRRINCPPGCAVERHEFDIAFLREGTQKDIPFLRLEVRALDGRRAWTNKLFV
ncbi:MAG: hypothetical protein BIFFINMI_02517 [Phycisphaerae bacterium]|nr:hypothetical protein [Phycisphaerae bacterium]